MTNIGVVLANALAFIAHCIDWFFCYKYKDKSRILQCNMLSSTMSIIICLILGAYAGAISSLVTLLRIVVIYYKDKYNKKWYVLFIVFCLLYMTVLFDNQGIWVILLWLSNYVIFIPKWFSKDTQKIRIGGILTCLMIIPYEWYIQNYVTMVLVIIEAIITVVSSIKWQRVKKSDSRLSMSSN